MNDIETIVVLKDAASAAIYGAQSGAGGVILVTTQMKHGWRHSRNQHSRLRYGVGRKRCGRSRPSSWYDATFGVRKASNVIEPLNAEEQLEMRKLSYANAGGIF